MADIKIDDIEEIDLEGSDLGVWNAYKETDGNFKSFLAEHPEIVKNISERKLKNVTDEIANKEIDFTNADSDAELKDSMEDLSSFSFSNEKGEPDPEIKKLFYELAQNETYADCLDEVNTDKYKEHLSNNIDTIKEELIINQVIFENCKDIDIGKLSEEKREELKQNYANLIENARNEFKKGQFKISPEVTAATMAIHNEDLKARAEKHGVKALIDRVKNFDEKATKKFPKLYPLAKNMLINAGAGMVAGPMGLAVVSGIKTFQAFKKLKKEANSQNKTLKEYLKENKTAAWSLGFQIAGSVITTAIGIDAGISGNFGMLHQGAVPYKTAFGARVGRVSASVGAGLSSAFGQLKKGNLKQGLKTIGLTAVAAGAGLILGEHANEWLGKLKEALHNDAGDGAPTSVDAISGAAAPQIDNQIPIGYEEDPVTHILRPIQPAAQPEGWHPPMEAGYDPNTEVHAPQQTLNNNINPDRPAIAPELQGASTATERFTMANDPTSEYGGATVQPQAESTESTADETTHWVRDEVQPDNSAAGAQAREMAQEINQGQYSADSPTQEMSDRIPTEPSVSPVAGPQQTGTEINTESTAHDHSNAGGNTTGADPIAQDQPTVEQQNSEPSSVAEHQTVNPRAAFDLNNQVEDSDSSFDARQDLDAIKNGSTYARTDGVPPLSETAAVSEQPQAINSEGGLDGTDTRVNTDSFTAAGQSGMRDDLDFVSNEHSGGVVGDSLSPVSDAPAEMSSGEKIWNDLMSQNTGTELSTNPSDAHALLDSAVVGADGQYHDLESTLPPNWYMGEAQDLPSGGTASPIYNDEGKLVGFMQDECLPQVNDNDIHRLTVVTNGERIIADVDMSNNEVISQTHVDNNNHTLHKDTFIRDEHGLGKIEPDVEFNGNSEQAAGLTTGLQENISASGEPLKLPEGYHLGEDVTHGANQSGRAILDGNGHNVGYLQEQAQGDATLRTITTQDGSSFQQTIVEGHVTEQTAKHADGTSFRTIFNYDENTNEVTSSEQFNYKDGQLTGRVETCTASTEADGFDGKVISSRDGQGNLIWEDKTGVDEHGNYYHSFTNATEHTSSSDIVDENGLRHIEKVNGDTKSTDIFDTKNHLPVSHSETVNGHTVESKFENDGKHVTGYSSTTDGKVTETGKFSYYDNDNIKSAVIKGSDGSTTEIKGSEDGLSSDVKTVDKEGHVTTQHTESVKIGDKVVVSKFEQTLPDGSKLEVHNKIDPNTGKITGAEMTSTPKDGPVNTYKVNINDDGSASYSRIVNGREVETGNPLDPKDVHHYHKVIDQKTIADQQARLDEIRDHKLAHDEHHPGKPTSENTTPEVKPDDKPNLWQKIPTWAKIAGGAAVAYGVYKGGKALINACNKKSAETLENYQGRGKNNKPTNSDTPTRVIPQNENVGVSIVNIGGSNSL